MNIQDVKRVVEQISRDKGIDRDLLIKALEEALKSAARKRFGTAIDIETMYDDDSGEIEIFQFKEVVGNVTDSDLQISLEEGRALDPECEVGDSLGVKMDTETFGRIAAQSAKQVIIQKIREAERKAVYRNFTEKEGEIINGIVQRLERGNVIVNIGEAEAILTVREQIPGEIYRRGDRVRANIMEVLEESAGPQIILSRAHAAFVSNLFKTEVPEISEGIITIKAIAREAGGRTKIAVVSNDVDIDPVGACVGVRGNRIQSVVKELRGEKIDIVPWSIDPAKFVCNALSPAEISRVIIDEDNATMEIVVPDDSHSLAIGRRGQNVRLASKLTGWHLDVQSESIYNRIMEKGYDSLLKIPGVERPMANALCEMGFFSAQDIAQANAEDLIEVEGIDDSLADELIKNAAAVEKDTTAYTDADAASLGSKSDQAVPDRNGDNSQPEQEKTPDAHT
ncbi:MAG: transcription termination factor NusA [Thermodesulfobacteriota bacterium]|nr:transcription termination factor NusA [Thermodesulfobacteriota bacterium]